LPKSSSDLIRANSTKTITKMFVQLRANSNSNSKLELDDFEVLNPPFYAY